MNITVESVDYFGRDERIVTFSDGRTERTSVAAALDYVVELNGVDRAEWADQI